MEGLQFRELPPLQNPLILSSMFDSCQFSCKDLKACRLVSKIWRENAYKAFKSSTKIIILQKPQMDDFLEYVENADNDQFRQIPLSHDYSTNINQPKFWKYCGSSIKILELDFVDFQTADDFRNIIFKWCRSLEKLTLFRISVLQKSVMDKPNNGNIPQFGENWNLKSLNLGEVKDITVSYMEIMSYFPSLQKLTLASSIWNLNSLFQAIDNIRKNDPSKLKLKSIEVTRSVTSDYCPAFESVLLDPNLKLESLSLGCSVAFQPGSRALAKFLDNQSSSLTKLIMHGQDDLYPADEIFPLPTQKEFPKLTELELRGVNFGSLTILKFCPNLKKFQLTGTESTVQNALFPGSSELKLTNCTELELELSWMSDEGDALSKWIDWFPNVKRLKACDLKNQHLELICERWANLETLMIWDGKGINDCGITGLDEEDVNRVNMEGEGGNWWPDKVPRANVSSLKKLRKLCIAATAPEINQPNSKLGYCAAAFGIGKISTLKHLSIDNYQLEGGIIWKNLRSQHPWSETEN